MGTILIAPTFYHKDRSEDLKWSLENKISTPFQQFWLLKLLGYSYEIRYKSGKENLMVDALSRVSGAEILCLSLSAIQSNLEELIQQSWQ